jgi:hypothetical protein
MAPLAATKAFGYLDGILPHNKVAELVNAIFTLEEAPDTGAVTRAMVR